MADSSFSRDRKSIAAGTAFGDGPSERSQGSPGGLGQFGGALRGAIDANALREKLRSHQALALWPTVAGEKLAGVCAAEAVRGNVLFVRVKSSAWANELTFYKADLLGKLNGKLGSKLIEDIHFATGRASGIGRSPLTAAPAPELRDLGRIAPSAPPAAALDPRARLEHLKERTRSVLAWKKANGWVPCARCDALFEPAASRQERASRRKLAADARICPVCVALTSR